MGAEILAALALAAANYETMPSKYWGFYAETLAECGDVNSINRLEVNWRGLTFYEGSSRIVQSIEMEDGSHVAMTEDSGEGRTWNRLLRVRVSESRDYIEVTFGSNPEFDSKQATFKWLRCKEF